MKSERVIAVLGMLVALAVALMFVAKRRADESPDGSGAPSSGEVDSSHQAPEADPLVDEMGRESFPASDPPATY